jgi:hypothetical protein
MCILISSLGDEDYDLKSFRCYEIMEKLIMRIEHIGNPVLMLANPLVSAPSDFVIFVNLFYKLMNTILYYKSTLVASLEDRDKSFILAWLSFARATLYQFSFGLFPHLLKVNYGCVPLGTCGVICLGFGFNFILLVFSQRNLDTSL